jgi:hypothetical protein
MDVNGNRFEGPAGLCCNHRLVRPDELKFPAHRAGLPGKDGSSFVTLTMTAHHDETGNALDLPVLSARPEFIEGCHRRMSKDAP